MKQNEARPFFRMLTGIVGTLGLLLILYLTFKGIKEVELLLFFGIFSIYFLVIAVTGHLPKWLFYLIPFARSAVDKDNLK